MQLYSGDDAVAVGATVTGSFYIPFPPLFPYRGLTKCDRTSPTASCACEWEKQ